MMGIWKVIVNSEILGESVMEIKMELTSVKCSNWQDGDQKFVQCIMHCFVYPMTVKTVLIFNLKFRYIVHWGMKTGRQGLLLW